MDNLRTYSERTPHKPAAIIAETGETLDFRTLDERSARLAHELVQRGLPEGAVIAILIANDIRYFELAWAARRAGLYYVPVSTHLTAGEAEYILQDCGAEVLFIGTELLPVLQGMSAASRQRLRIVVVDGDAPPLGERSYRDIVDAGPMPPLPQRAQGLDFAYSSGTTGKPKGIKHRMQSDPAMQRSLAGGWLSFFSFSADTVYLSPAPLYHAAPLRFSIRTMDAGGTAVVMRRFHPEHCLAAIEKYRITHSQWVPTMFVRMLALTADVRSGYDLSSHRYALHGAAPCAQHVKRQMINWWGEILWEYYSMSERAGATVISAQEWLAHPGSVGRCKQSTLHILDEERHECATGVDGVICFEGSPKFEYHNDPVKTAASHTPEGWVMVGDIGHVDAEGYLYLTDRLANMIISGGVNIYPQEAENLLSAHPLVAEVAVIGVPNAEFGEEVKAVVELHDPALAGDTTAQALMAFCREHLSHVKCPRSVDFIQKLPRSETGKLMKRLVRDGYRVRAVQTQA
jgi:long-chain acyl-CoA synthetase